MSPALIDRHRQAYAYCAYCPKMCRFACPVSDATQTETTSTWGKMSEAFLVTTGKRSLEPGGARALYACTGCMRCRSFCAHNNEVGFALFSARRLSVESEVAPIAALSTLETFKRSGNPFGKDLSDVRGRHGAGGRVRLQLYPGCSALARRPQTVETALAVAERLGTPLGIAEVASRCCGYPLYAAGDTDAFEAHAQRTAQALSGQPELAVLDPGCAYTFRVVYPRMGIELRCSVRTLVEVLAERVGNATEHPPLEETVAYHDACHLGRGLGQYDEPRRLLRAAVRSVREGYEKEEEAGCSGGGGLLPRTMRETAVAIARRQADRIAANGQAIVSACPTSVRMFERAGRRSEELLSVLRRWLGEGR